MSSTVLPSYLTAPNFSARHGFFTRLGGVSSAPYDSLNCGLGRNDTVEHVRENKARATRALGTTPDSLITLRQVHGTQVFVANKPLTENTGPEADAAVSRTPGITLGILTADCCPVLFYDPNAKIIGAAHAGWRSAFDGIIKNTVIAMEQLGAKRAHIQTAIGPTIGQKSYEVGAEFIERFITQSPENEMFFKPSTTAGHALFDLPAYVTSCLTQSHITSISNIHCDTCAEPERFFSYRYECLNSHDGAAGVNARGFGSLLSAITLE